MENLLYLGLFFGGVGVLFVGSALLWWCSLYAKINLFKEKKVNVK